MVTIALDPLRGSGIMPRASVNGLYFVEAEPLRGSGVLVDARVGSKTDIHSILGWTPENNAAGAEIGNPVTVNFKAENSVVAELDLATGTEFDDLGTHDGTKQSGTALALATEASADDFESYSIGTNLVGNGWTARTSLSAWTVQQQVSGDSQHAQFTQAGRAVISLDAAGDDTDMNVLVRCQTPDTVHANYFGACARLTGSGTALRGYVVFLSRGSTNFVLRRFTGDGIYFGIATGTVVAPAADEWWMVRLRCIGTQILGKAWKEGDAEPVSWTVGATNSVHAGPGASGVFAQTADTSRKCYYDDFSVEAIPPKYASSGTWTSDPLDVSAAVTLASSRIGFDATTPTDTTAAVKCRWGAGDIWLTCGDGQPLPGAEYRDDMTAGAAKSLLELRIELATTDTSATPDVDNLRVDFDPCLFADVELVVDGQSATIENQHLAKWGREQVSAGVELDAFDDLTVQAFGFQNYRLAGETITAVFKFDEYTVGSVLFSQLLQAFKVGGADGYFAFSAGALEGVAVANWNAWTRWYRTQHDYTWTLIDKTQGIHADAWFWVGHAQTNDQPASMIVALAQLSDHVGSLIAKGYARDDFLGMALIQGWRRDDSPGMILPALQKMDDFFGMTVVAIGHRTDAPGSLLVYGVNRRNEIEIQTIDADTVSELEKLGFVFPAEAP